MGRLRFGRRHFIGRRLRCRGFISVAFEAMPQGGQSAVGVHPPAQRGNDPLAGLFLMQGFQLLPNLGLGVPC